MKLNNFIKIMVGFILVIGILIFLWWHHYNSVHKQKLTSFIVSKGPWISALVVDLSGERSLSHASVLQKGDGVLVIHDDTNAYIHLNDFMSDRAVLSLFDKNRDGVIDPHDPVFYKLEVWVFVVQDKVAHLHRIPLSQVGIRAIFVGHKRLPSNMQNDLKEMRHVMGGVVMADGSTRLIRDISIDESLFKR